MWAPDHQRAKEGALHGKGAGPARYVAIATVSMFIEGHFRTRGDSCSSFTLFLLTSSMTTKGEPTFPERSRGDSLVGGPVWVSGVTFPQG